MQLDFLTPRVERLSADGAIDVVHPGGALGRVLRRPVLLLARDLCAFGLFQTAALPRGLSKEFQPEPPKPDLAPALAGIHRGARCWHRSRRLKPWRARPLPLPDPRPAR